MVIIASEVAGKCYSHADGDALALAIDRAVERDGAAEVSFTGVLDIPSSFVNAAFVPLVEAHGVGWLKERVRIVHSTRQINNMIRACVSAASSHLLETA